MLGIGVIRLSNFLRFFLKCCMSIELDLSYLLNLIFGLRILGGYCFFYFRYEDFEFRGKKLGFLVF